LVIPDCDWTSTYNPVVHTSLCDMSRVATFIRYNEDLPIQKNENAEGFKEKSGNLIPALIIRSMNSETDVARINHIPTLM